MKSVTIDNPLHLRMKMARCKAFDGRIGRRSIQIQSGEAARIIRGFHEWRKTASFDLICRVWPVASWAMPNEFKFPHAPLEIILAKTPDIPDEAVKVALLEIGFCAALAQRASTTPKVDAGQWIRTAKPRGVFIAPQESAGEKYRARYGANFSIDELARDFCRAID